MNVVGTHLKCLNEALQMSTHNIHFHGEITKKKYIYIGSSLLSGAMILACITVKYVNWPTGKALIRLSAFAS